MRLFFVIILTLLLVFTSSKTKATHIYAGEIRVEVLDCASLTVKITLIGYVSASAANFGNSPLIFGDGTEIIVPPLNKIQITDNYFKVTYETIYQYKSAGIYLISYSTGNRTFDIANIKDSGNTFFHIESEVFLAGGGQCYGTPQLKTNPIDEACSGTIFEHNPASFADSGDSLAIELTTPKQFRDKEIAGYSSPINFSQSNESQTGPSSIEVNDEGTIIWDAPGSFGLYTITLTITRYVFENNEWKRVSYMVRDMSVNVKPCELNNRPFLEFTEELCVEAGTYIKENIRGFDADSDDVLVEVYSEFETESENFFLVEDSVWRETAYPSPATHVLNWQTTCEEIRPDPYKLIFKISDRKEEGGVLTVAFKAMYVTIVPPRPILEEISFNFENKSMVVSWENYVCGSSYNELRVLRNNDNNGLETEIDCIIDINEGLYTEITNLSTQETLFTDFEYVPGATLCYRLVFSDDIKQSAISNEICIGPLSIDAPVPLKVSVDETDKTEGSIELKWMPPIEINNSLFGDDFTYYLYHGFGFNPVNYSLINTTKDLNFTHNTLNTADSIHSYKIYFSSNNSKSVSPGIIIDSSAVASQVHLDLSSDKDNITLNWDFITPWSNSSINYPTARIYKGTNPEELIQIDEINVLDDGFSYMDSNELISGVIYYYQVETIGSYNNPKIEEPLLNKSQIIGGFLLDEAPPTIGELSTTFNCNSFDAEELCSTETYDVLLQWTPSQNELNDISEIEYEIYYSPLEDGPFEKIGTTFNLEYLHIGKSESRGNYYIRAKDLAGNLSFASNHIKIDNCNVFIMPNVLTLSVNDGCNEIILLNDTDGCGMSSNICMRFVKEIHFMVLNRWGEGVNESIIAEESPNTVLWDGTNTRGNRVSNGIYYYSAEVVFENGEEVVYKGNITVL